MASNNQLKLGAIMSYVAIAINIATGLLYTPWMIHSIGRENFGLYTLAMSVISLFVFDFGLSAAVTRFIAKYLAEDRQDKANNCLGLVYRLYLAIDIVMLLILVGVFFFIPQIYRELTLVEIEKFKVVYCVAAIYSVISFPFIPVNGILTAHEKFIQVKICDVLHKLIIVVSMSICLLFGYGLYALVIVSAISGIFTIAFKLYCIRRYTPQLVNWKYFNKLEFRSIVGFSGWVTVLALAQRCIFTIAPSILGALSGSTSIAILGIAMTLEGYTYTISSAINGMFLPRVTRIISNENGDILPLMIKVGRIQMYVTSLVTLGIICLGREFIYLWVGESFDESYLCAVLIILPALFSSPQEIGNQAIYADNKVKELALYFSIGAIVNVMLSLLLSPLLGATGICISVFIVYIFRTMGMDIILYKKMKVDVVCFFKECFLKLLFPLTICLIIGYACTLIIPFKTWFGLMLKGVIFLILYCIVIYFLAANQCEKELIVTPIRKIYRRWK